MAFRVELDQRGYVTSIMHVEDDDVHQARMEQIGEVIRFVGWHKNLQSKAVVEADTARREWLGTKTDHREEKMDAR